MYDAIMSEAKAAKKSILLRLPNDLADRLGAIVPPRHRSRFLIDLLRRELQRESYELSEAAQRLSRLESAGDQAESQGWVSPSFVEEADPFDAAEFERQFRQAQGG